MSQHILSRHDTAANWTSNNPILSAGEIGIETDTRKFKFGTGAATWSALPYVVSAGGSGDMLAANNLSDLVNAVTARTNLGLGSVNNTSDASKPVSTAQQAAIDASKNSILNGAGAALDTLLELGAALGNDANYAATVTTALGNKLGTGAGAVGTANIADGAVTSAKMASMATKTYLGRSSAGTGVVEGVPAATLAIDLGVNLKADVLAPVALTGATNLTRAAHANRQITFSGASATLTVQSDAIGGTTGDDAFEVHTLAGSAGVPTISTPDGKTITGSPTKIVGAVRKGTDSWTVGTTDPTAGGGSSTPALIERMADSGFGFHVPNGIGGSAQSAVGMNQGAPLDTSAANSGCSTADLGGTKPRLRFTTAAAAVNRVTGLAWPSSNNIPFRLDVVGTFNGGFPLVIEAAASDGALSTNSGTVTITSANPGVVTFAAHGGLPGQPVKFSTTGALPTNIVAGTTYYVLAGGSLTTNTFAVSATVGGSPIDATTGTQSGVHTATFMNGSFFMGLTNFTAPNFTATDPSGWGANDILGIGWDSTGANSDKMYLFRNDNAGAVVVSSLGVTFAKTQGQLYRIVIDKDPVTAGSVTVKAVQVNVGGTNVETAVFTLSTDIPRGTLTLSPCVARSTMAGAFAASIDFAGLWRGRLS